MEFLHSGSWVGSHLCSMADRLLMYNFGMSDGRLKQNEQMKQASDESQYFILTASGGLTRIIKE